jgi:uncharacterized membrane protein
MVFMVTILLYIILCIMTFYNFSYIILFIIVGFHNFLYIKRNDYNLRYQTFK